MQLDLMEMTVDCLNRNSEMIEVRKLNVLLYLLTHLSPRVCLNLREFELGVVGVHLADLFSGRSAQNLRQNIQCERQCHWVEWKKKKTSTEQAGFYLDDFNQLVHSTVARKDRLS